MKRVKQYRIRLTEEEDELLKQVARETGLSVADVIRLGIKYQIRDLEYKRLTKLREDSGFLKNWEQYFGQSIIQEFGSRWQTALQTAYLQTLMEYKDSICYIDEKFEIISSITEVEKSSDTTPIVEETSPESISEQKVKEDICQSLAKYLGGEWNGDEGIVQIFLNGLKADLLYRE
ncbi:MULTISPECIES: hypothetical protein [Fischerella]|uniref:Uncharacterized protein n=1 Tax=Fischerella muscicola CCMEE 5323 TaxID=2019572 RepID=A0A2N6JUZ2_FISMU|nr:MULTISPECIES: hypothetical protein [Fischerella]MBD2433431.1 hypothetical protein [Fischerella sp. FACHB-380]PLZ82379.1 hypothetical protein CEN44_27820 [Fischerella muscicola CCMEE 5323]